MRGMSLIMSTGCVPLLSASQSWGCSWFTGEQLRLRNLTSLSEVNSFGKLSERWDLLLPSATYLCLIIRNKTISSDLLGSGLTPVSLEQK